VIVSIDELHDLAEKTARKLCPGRPLLLSGPLGAGKTTFARSLLRTYDPTLVHVPSPSFALMLPYDFGDMRVWHIDLYRLLHEEEVAALDIPTLISKYRCIIEWPERMGRHAPDRFMHCMISFLKQRPENPSDYMSLCQGSSRLYTMHNKNP
jgi:tRNA threonylcarbamoyladenosine biosynthesis protein TsaE